MKRVHRSALLWLTAVCCSGSSVACSSSEETPGTASVPASNTTQPPSTSNAGSAGRSVTTTAGSTGTLAPSVPRAGSAAPTGGNSSVNPPRQPSAAGSSTAASAGQGGTGTVVAAGGASGAANSGGASAPAAGGAWATADPAKTGPFATTTEQMVGPGMAFTMVRPTELTRRHPVITWGNGTGTTPMVYRSLLDLYASHGFIVIASNSENVGQGDPPPMLDGVTWVLAQDMTAGSSLFEHVDRENIGATGHSQGAFAASSAGLDERITSIAPIQVLGTSRGLHGPVLALCGTMDTVLPCSSNMRSYSAIADQPVMYAELKAADHMNWIFSAGGANPFWVITNAWFRVHLMGDTSLRPMFYGADCTFCKDDAWVIMRKMMD